MRGCSTMEVGLISRLILFILIFHSFDCVVCWDNEDLELFDLVEEVNQNFYDILNVSESADGSELRRAYRRLSLQLHPDKNKEADAELKFRQMVSIYEVLKDEGKRAKYNEVLTNGLPDWQQPVYYYRRVRKMGLIELGILLSFILTTGHFITLWSIYLEKCFEKQEVYRARKKRDKKGRRGRPTAAADGGDSDDDLQDELNLIKRPVIIDLLPFAFYRMVVRFVKSLPGLTVVVFQSLCDRLKSRPAEEEACDDDNESVERFRTVRKRPNLAGPAPETLPCDFPPPTTVAQFSYSDLDVSQTTYATHAGEGEWTDAEIALLAKAMARFPGGTSDRWQKISTMVGRSVKEVTAMSHQTKTNYARSVDPRTQGITATVLPNNLPDVLSSPTENLTEYELPVDERSARASKSKVNGAIKAKSSTKKVDYSQFSAVSQANAGAAGSPSAQNVAAAADGGAKGTWTQQQQRLLEIALSQHPRGTVDRWDRIAEMIPGKAKEECMQRFKYLAELVKKKQQKVEEKPIERLRD